MRVAITGATGFVGGRLAERLALEGQDPAVGIVRRFSGPGLARLARLGVPMVQAALTDSRALTEAFAGCDVVVHCAYGTSGTPQERYLTTVEGTSTVLRSARDAGARRVVHLSSTVVHGLPRKGTIDEAAPLARPQTPYDRMKRDAEDRVWEFHSRHEFPVVVLRPPLIYGPHGRRWTERILREVQAGAIIVDGGRGAANFLHVDNLVDAILISVRSDAGDGRAYILVDEEPSTWRQVYEGYARLLPEAPPLRSASRAEIETLRRKIEPGPVWASTVLPIRLLPTAARTALESPELRTELKKVPWLRGAAAATRSRRQRAATERAAAAGRPADSSAPREYVLPDPDFVELMTCRGRYSANRARSELRWSPSVAFPDALAVLADWIEYQRLGRSGP